MTSRQHLFDTATRLERVLRLITGPERASVACELDDVQQQCGRLAGGHMYSPIHWGESTPLQECVICGKTAMHERKAA